MCTHTHSNHMQFSATGGQEVETTTEMPAIYKQNKKVYDTLGCNPKGGCCYHIGLFDCFILNLSTKVHPFQKYIKLSQSLQCVCVIFHSISLNRRVQFHFFIFSFIVLIHSIGFPGLGENCTQHKYIAHTSIHVQPIIQPARKISRAM